MSLNRDLAILFARSYFPHSHNLTVCDPTTASGIRSARYALECPNANHIIAADIDPIAAELASKNTSLNNLQDKVSVSTSDANKLLLNHMTSRFDLIDLDPFGSPAPFFESALRATIDGGVLAATATDMGPLSGARPAACKRKYGIHSVRTEFEKEMAVRILLACLAIIAGRLELGISAKFCHASDHYARLYVSVVKGRKAANQSQANLLFMQYCPKCLNRKNSISLDHLSTVCESCGSRAKIGGPIWVGSLWDDSIVEAMIGYTPTLISSRLSEVQKILEYIKREKNCSPFYYTTDSVARVSRTRPVGITRVVESLRKKGFLASETHFNPVGFRTTASAAEVASLFREVSLES